MSLLPILRRFAHAHSPVLTSVACLAEIGQAPSHETGATTDNGGSKYKQMFQLRSLHLMAIFILIYVGVEVTLGGSHKSIDSYSSFASNYGSYRVGGHLPKGPAWWRTICRIRFFRILRRYE